MPERPAPESNVIAGHYIVVFEDSVCSVAAGADRRERRLGFRTRLRYRHAIRGFAARLSPAQARRLRRDPGVDFVSRDRRVEASGEVPLEPGETVPTGVRRILAATETTAREPSGASVAVLDTGIELSHPDLNAGEGTNCISPGSPANDVHGHGTHVAGTLAAKNNGFGVVGVAPGTEVHAVKMLDDEGEGTTSSAVCGIDWVTANREALGIGVANMSLSGLGVRVRSCASTADAMHRAICESTAAGVNYVVAAGNDGWDFDHPVAPNVPAAYPQVLTVTAISDSDGEPRGSGGPPTCRQSESDDSAASFSNFAATPEGEAHTIAAPGVCIRSTFRGGGYATASGTSMASPHLAGVVALCINEGGTNAPCAGKTPAEVITHMRDDAEVYNTANPGYGFFGDPSSSPLLDRYYGFLTRTLPPPPCQHLGACALRHRPRGRDPDRLHGHLERRGDHLRLPVAALRRRGRGLRGDRWGDGRKPRARGRRRRPHPARHGDRTEPRRVGERDLAVERGGRAAAPADPFRAGDHRLRSRPPIRP